MLTSLNEIYFKNQKADDSSKIGANEKTPVSFECYIEKIVDSESKVHFIFRDRVDKISGYQIKAETKNSANKSGYSKIPLESFVKVIGVLEINDIGTSTSSPNDSTIPSLRVKVEEINVLCECECTLPLSLTDVFNTGEDEDLSNLPRKYEGILKNTDQRFLSLRLIENQAIFSIRSKLKNLFTKFFLENDFIEVDTPKLLPYLGVVEDQSFRVDYFGREVYLNQHAGLHTAACMQGGMERVFRVGVNFRAEKRVSNRHLTQFTVVSFKMRINKDGSEIYGFLWKALSNVFSQTERECEKELKILRKRFGESVGKVNIGEKPIVLKYDEAVELINRKYGEGLEKCNRGLLNMGDDFRAEDEKLLGRIVKEKYDSDFFVINEFPFNLRGFYSKLVEDAGNSRSRGMKKAFSFDTFMKGEEISSGSELESNYETVIREANNTKSRSQTEGFLKLILEGYKYGMPKTGGLAVGFDRLVKLFLGFEDIKSVVLFPRDYSSINP